MKKSFPSIKIASFALFFVLGFVLSIQSAHAGFVDSEGDIGYIVKKKMPDLVPKAPTPATAFINEPLTFSSVITNIGDKTTGDKFSVLFQQTSEADGGGSISNLTPAVFINTLAVGKSATATSPQVTFTKIGTYSIKVCADNAEAIDESDELNNCKLTNIVVKQIPEVELTVNKPTGSIGEVPTLTWTTKNDPEKCDTSGDWKDNGPRSEKGGGPEAQAAFTTNKTYTYTITCSKGSVSVSSTATVKVGSAPIVTLTADPIQGPIDTAPILTWTVENTPAICVASDTWNGSRDAEKGKAKSSPEQQPKLKATGVYNYTLTCSNAAGSGSSTAKVTITTKGEPKKPDLIVSTPSTYTVNINTLTDFSAEVSNQGNAHTDVGAASGKKKVKIPNIFQYYEDAKDAKKVTITEIASIVKPLDVGKTDTTFYKQAFPRKGKWYIRFCTDKTSVKDLPPGAIIESNEDNNCSDQWTLVNVEDKGIPACGPRRNTCTNTIMKVGSDGSDLNTKPYRYTWMCESVADTCYYKYPDCSDGIDNEGDKKTDWAADGSGDPDCVDPEDTSEQKIRINVIEQ